MLLRDKYQGDPVVKYFPDFSIVKYLQHISATKPYYSLIFNQSQAEKWKSEQSYTNNWVFATFCLFLVPVIFHKRIPGLKRFTSKKARFFFGLLFIFVPPSIVSQYFSTSFEKKIQQSYQLHGDDFVKYRMTGDILRINDQIKFADI